MPDTETIYWLMQWCLSHCDGEWEHRYGVRIDTLDNPGWSLTIDLTGTLLKDRTFETVKQGKPSENLEEWCSLGSWWVCHREGDQFRASCGPLDLVSVIDIFRSWNASS